MPDVCLHCGHEIRGDARTIYEVAGPQNITLYLHTTGVNAGLMRCHPNDVEVYGPVAHPAGTPHPIVCLE